MGDMGYMGSCHFTSSGFCPHFYHFLFLQVEKTAFSHLRTHCIAVYLSVSTLAVLRHMNVCAYLLLCLREGEAEGEGTEVRGVGTGHLRIGSSRMLSFSISSIIYSTETWRQAGNQEDGQRGREGERQYELREKLNYAGERVIKKGIGAGWKKKWE